MMQPDYKTRDSFGCPGFFVHEKAIKAEKERKMGKIVEIPGVYKKLWENMDKTT